MSTEFSTLQFGQPTANSRGVLDPNDVITLSGIQIEGNERVTTSLFYRYFQETALPVSLPVPPKEEKRKDENKKPEEKVVITQRTCLSCIPTPVPPASEVSVEVPKERPCHVKLRSQKISTVYESLQHVTQRLLQLQLFDQVDTNLILEDFDKETNKYKGKVVITVKEKGPRFLNFSSYVQGGGTATGSTPNMASSSASIGSSVGVELQAALRSPLGYGETVSLAAKTGHGGGREYSFQVRVPSLGLLSPVPRIFPLCLLGGCGSGGCSTGKCHKGSSHCTKGSCNKDGCKSGHCSTGNCHKGKIEKSDKEIDCKTGKCIKNSFITFATPSIALSPNSHFHSDIPDIPAVNNQERECPDGKCPRPTATAATPCKTGKCPNRSNSCHTGHCSRKTLSPTELRDQSLTGGPFTATLHTKEDLSLVPIASLSQSLKSLSLDYATPSGRHQIAYDLSLRDELPQVRSPASSLPFTPNTTTAAANGGFWQKLTGSSPAEGDAANGDINVSVPRADVTDTRTASPQVLHSAMLGLRQSFKHIYTVLDTRVPAPVNAFDGAMLQVSTEFVSNSHHTSNLTDLSRQDYTKKAWRNLFQAVEREKQKDPLSHEANCPNVGMNPKVPYQGRSSNHLFYVRNEINVEKHWMPLIHSRDNHESGSEIGGLVISIAGSLGMIHPLTFNPIAQRAIALSTQQWCPLPDRYQLGGPLSLRGYHVGGIGPRAAGSISDTASETDSLSLPLGTPSSPGDSLGGTTKSSLLLLASVPVPFDSLRKATMRAFCFANIGSIGHGSLYSFLPAIKAEREKMGEKDTQPFFGYARASVGTGLSISFSKMIRVEMTYSMPLLKNSQDQVKPFQLGVGLSIN